VFEAAVVIEDVLEEPVTALQHVQQVQAPPPPLGMCRLRFQLPQLGFCEQGRVDLLGLLLSAQVSWEAHQPREVPEARDLDPGAAHHGPELVQLRS